MDNIGFSPRPTVVPLSAIFPAPPPFLMTIDDFKEYINTQLRAPTRLPLEALKHELESFIGSDRLPVDIYDIIMEFELEQVATLYRYRFVQIVENIPANRLNKKYFVYTYTDEETGEEFIDEDNTIYAYDVYEV